jgi:hypothetical protein
MDQKKMAKWIEIRKRIAVLNEELADLKEDSENLEYALVEEMATDGISSMKVNGVSVYVQEKHLASINYQEGEDTDAGYARVCDILNKVGLGYLAHRRFSIPSLTKWVNEQKEAGNELPPEFEGNVRIETKFKLIPRGIKAAVAAEGD